MPTSKLFHANYKMRGVHREKSVASSEMHWSFQMRPGSGLLMEDQCWSTWATERSPISVWIATHVRWCSGPEGTTQRKGAAQPRLKINQTGHLRVRPVRAMISVLSILVHNGTHIDAPSAHDGEGRSDRPDAFGQLVKEGVLINAPNKGPNSVVTVKDIEESGVELGPNRIPVIHTGFTEKTGASRSSGPRCPIWRRAWER